VAHPDRTAFVDIIAAVCDSPVALCDDTVAGVPARPDGVHYEGPGADLAIDALFARLEPILARTGTPAT
jgi:hypothetical protein